VGPAVHHLIRGRGSVNLTVRGAHERLGRVAQVDVDLLGARAADLGLRFQAKRAVVGRNLPHTGFGFHARLLAGSLGWRLLRIAGSHDKSTTQYERGDASSHARKGRGAFAWHVRERPYVNT